jgi:deoxyribose-phosphate aldolase
MTAMTEQASLPSPREQASRLLTAWDGRPSPVAALVAGIGGVDQVAVEERVESLRRRSIKRESKLWALELAVRMMDLRTLEGRDTPGKVRALSAKARRPDPSDPSITSVAAV